MPSEAKAVPGQVNIRLRAQPASPRPRPQQQPPLRFLPTNLPHTTPRPRFPTNTPAPSRPLHQTHLSRRANFFPAQNTRLQTPSPSRHGVPPEQQPDRHPQRRHLPPLRAHPRRRHLAGRARRRHRVRALPLGARHRGGGLPPGGLRGGARRRLLPRHVAPLGLPARHVRPHRRALRLHRLRVRRHQPRRRGGRLRPRVQGVPPRGLLRVAAEAGGERQELGPDQELPPGLQGLQEPPGQERVLAAVRPLRPLPHPVRLLQAPHQLRLRLRRRHGVDHHQHQLDGPGLQDLEQRRHEPLLRLPVLQGRRGGHLQAGLEARRRRQHRLPRLHRHRLLRRLLRLQEQPQGQRLPWRLEGRTRIRLIDHRLQGFSIISRLVALSS